MIKNVASQINRLYTIIACNACKLAEIIEPLNIKLGTVAMGNIGAFERKPLQGFSNNIPVLWAF